MHKDTTDESRSFTIKFLKKHDYLKEGYTGGSIIWTYQDRKNSIGIKTRIDRYSALLTLDYTVTSHRDGTKKDMDYDVRLVTTPCFFGGKRYWFICPLMRNNIPCGKRVGVLYLNDSYFICRTCADLAYESQCERRGWLYKGIKALYDFNEVGLPRVKYWHGRPTKRYRKILQSQNQRDDALEAFCSESDSWLRTKKGVK